MFKTSENTNNIRSNNRADGTIKRNRFNNKTEDFGE